MRARFISPVIIIVILVLVSCRRDQYRVNVSSIKADVEIKRLEKDLFGPDPATVISIVPRLQEKYGNFLQLFSWVINTGDVNDPSFGDFLVRFCTDRTNNEVYGAAMKVFPDTKIMEANLEDAFRHYLHYLPGKTIPAVYTCISGFNNSIITGDSALGISLDRYLGADSEYYPRLGIYKYISDRMTPENVVPDAIYGWGASEWIFDSTGYAADNVLSHIIHEGKLKYFEKCMLPEATDELLFGFTTEQMKFCRNNEEQMWLYLIENNLLFSTDQFTIRKLTGEAPFTSYFTSESPGRAAVWTGFRIIEEFMTRNRETGMQELMRETDCQLILSKAKYNP